jgi:carbonic anhydrase/acetyltransferase-like protein (isoleucine patch superfamily)
MIVTLKGRAPKVHPRAFIAPNATLIGRVAVGEGSSVWFGAVLRGDIAPITVGRGTNIQDNAVLHVERGIPCRVGNGVVIGHQATVHACTVKDGALIGIGARVLNGAVVGERALVAAGAVVLEGAVIPPGTLAVGVPAKPVRRLTPRDLAAIRRNALGYRKLGELYRKVLGASGGAGLGALADLARIL